MKVVLQHICVKAETSCVVVDDVGYPSTSVA